MDVALLMVEKIKCLEGEIGILGHLAVDNTVSIFLDFSCEAFSEVFCR